MQTLKSRTQAGAHRKMVNGLILVKYYRGLGCAVLIHSTVPLSVCLTYVCQIVYSKNFVRW